MSFSAKVLLLVSLLVLSCSGSAAAISASSGDIDGDHDGPRSACTSQDIADVVQIEVKVIGRVRDLAYLVIGQHLLQDVAYRHFTNRKSQRAVAEVHNVYCVGEILIQKQHFWRQLGRKHTRHKKLQECQRDAQERQLDRKCATAPHRASRQPCQRPARIALFYTEGKQPTTSQPYTQNRQPAHYTPHTHRQPASQRQPMASEPASQRASRQQDSRTAGQPHALYNLCYPTYTPAETHPQTPKPEGKSLKNRLLPRQRAPRCTLPHTLDLPCRPLPFAYKPYKPCRVPLEKQKGPIPRVEDGSLFLSVGGSLFPELSGSHLVAVSTTHSPTAQALWFLWCHPYGYAVCFYLQVPCRMQTVCCFR